MAEKEELKLIVRVSNTDINGEKPIVDALRKVKGVSFMFANALCKVSGVTPTKKAGLLSDAELNKIQASLQNPSDAGIPDWMLNRRDDYETGENMHIIVNDIKFIQDNDIKRMKKTKSYKGLRHQAGLPVRGQRTKSNFRKNKGKK